MQPLELALIVFELVVMALSISIHDAAQAWMADRLGDPTARMVGRISISPVEHFDPFGMVIWPLVSILIFHSTLPFCWGRPVPMTYRNFRKKNGELYAILAGPGAQLLVAGIALVVLVVIKHTIPGTSALFDIATMLSFRMPLDGLAGLPSIFPVVLLLYMSIVVNLALAIVNIMPVSFLDGGKVLTYLLPYNAAQSYQKNSMFFMIGFFLLGGYLVAYIFTPLFGLFNALLTVL
jgi:Zn-dependent protease